MGPVAMGWGVTRNKVYTFLLWMTRQSLEDRNGSDEKPVSNQFWIEATIS